MLDDLNLSGLINKAVRLAVASELRKIADLLDLDDGKRSIERFQEALNGNGNYQPFAPSVPTVFVDRPMIQPNKPKAVSRAAKSGERDYKVQKRGTLKEDRGMDCPLCNEWKPFRWMKNKVDDQAVCIRCFKGLGGKVEPIRYKKRKDVSAPGKPIQIPPASLKSLDNGPVVTKQIADIHTFEGILQHMKMFYDGMPVSISTLVKTTGLEYRSVWTLLTGLKRSGKVIQVDKDSTKGGHVRYRLPQAGDAVGSYANN